MKKKKLSGFAQFCYTLRRAGSSALKGTMSLQTSTLGTWTTVPVTNRFVLPASMQRHLNRTSGPGGTVYKTR